MRLRDFSTLSFDCYGTLIDWERGLLEALEPLLAAAGVAQPPGEVLAEFGRRESAQQEATPGMRYPQLLRAVHRQLAQHWHAQVPESLHAAFGDSVPRWPAFPDSAPALQYLEGHYQLVILSNVDRASFAASNARLGVQFDLICTAEDIGSYKPDARNFAYLIESVGRLGVGKHELLHTAQSLHHDHVPAQAAGLASAWIDRRHEQPGWGATRAPAGKARYDFRFTSLAALAAAHAAES